MVQPIDSLVALQQNNNQVVPNGLALVSSPLLPNRSVRDRMEHFDPSVFNLAPEGHLYKLVGALLGGAGVGGLKKLMLMKRLGQTLHGTNFYNLDRFYGALFGVERLSDERLSVDVTEESASALLWDEQYARDGSYRSRLEQFAQAIQYGATPIGIKLAAESLLNAECWVFEAYRYDDDPTVYATELGQTGSRREFVVQSSRDITEEERYFLLRVLERLKPADSVLTIKRDGIGNIDEVGIHSIVSDSNYWDVYGEVVDRKIGDLTPYGTGSEETVELRKPPFSNYQGEAWGYRADVTQVRSYTDANPNALNYDRIVFTKVGFPDSYIDYLPSKALLPTRALLSGRLASDGISVSHPLNDLGDISKLFIDHVDAETLAQALNIIDEPLLISSSQNFWATPSRNQDDATVEYLEIVLSNARLMNQVSFDMSRFPATATLEGSSNGGDWVELDSYQTVTSSPAQINPVSPELPVHPQHGGSDHWVRVQFRIRPTRYDRIRIRMVRTAGIPPVDTSGSAIPYSLAVKNLELGYRVRNRTDVQFGGKDYREIQIGSTVDRLGTPTSFVFRNYTPDKLLDDDFRLWKSDLQVTKDAAVSLYMDTRDARGFERVIDEFEIDPMVSGATASVYLSNDDVTGNAPASEHRVAVTQVGTITPCAGVNPPYIQFDDAAPAYADMSNEYVQFDMDKAWWVGVRLLPSFDASDAEEHPVISFGEHQLRFAPNSLKFTAYADNTIEVPTDHVRFNEVRAVLAYIPEQTETLSAGMHLFYRREDGEVVSASVGSARFIRPELIRIGGAIGADGSGDINQVSGMLLRQLVVKEEVLGSDTVSDFFDNAAEYVIRPEFPVVGAYDRTQNAILRVASNCPFSPGSLFVRGGPLDRHAARSWKPVALNFRVTKGIIRFKPRSAKWWKIEFTNLVPMPYDNFLQLNRETKVHPDGIQYHSRLPKSTAEDVEFRAALRAIVARLRNQRVSGEIDEQIAQVITRYRITPLELLSALDPSSAQRLRSTSWVYGWEDHHISPLSPKFDQSGVHTYDVRDVEHRTNVAYQVGLRRLKARRVDDTVMSDTQAYFRLLAELPQPFGRGSYGLVETELGFYGDAEAYLYEDIEDLGSLSLPASWSVTDVGWVAEQVPVLSVSDRFESLSDVWAAQVAVQRSEAKQMVPNYNFAQLSDGYAFDGSEGWERFGSSVAIYEPTRQAVSLTRFAGGSYGIVEDELVDYESVEDYSYEGIEQYGFGSSGGIRSESVAVSGSKNYYAACQVSVESDLSKPMWLRLIDESDVVVAEQSFSPQAGRVVNFWVPYFTEGAAPTTLRVELMQKDPTDDSFRIHKLGVFDAQVTIDVSVDDGVTWMPADPVFNNRSGVIQFPEPGRQLRWRAIGHRIGAQIGAFEIRPWYVGQRAAAPQPERRGASLDPDDFEPTLERSPEFKNWKLPIPAWWFED